MGSSATEFRRVLDALESIRAVVGSAGELSLPQICVVGDQSSGKSTLLGSLVEGLNEVLPQGAGTCTLAPIVVALRRAREGEQPSITVGDKVSSWDEEGRHKAQEIIRELQKQGDFRQSIAVPAPSPPLDSPAGGDPSSDDIDIEAREVIVRVSHPEAVDLTVVDLPGLVQNAKGWERVEAMVRKYIRSPDCLIVVVQPANDDVETTAAARFAAEVDPAGARTLTVFTKCDVFSERANKLRVVDSVRAGQGQPRGTHAVCCFKKSAGDNVAWSREDESDFFRNDDDFAGLVNVGSAALGGFRLPALLAELIKSNVPRLRQQVQTRLNEAAAVLRDLGEAPRDKGDVRRDLQKHVALGGPKLDRELTVALNTLREKLFAHRDKVTYELVSERLVFSAFSPPFFQGEDVFKACVREIVHDWWAPDILGTVEECLRLVNERALVVDAFSSTSPDLGRAYKDLWAHHARQMDEELRRRTDDELRRASKFGTLNHYLDAKFELDAQGLLTNAMDKWREMLTRVLQDIQEKVERDRRLQQHLRPAQIDLFAGETVENAAAIIVAAWEEEIKSELADNKQADLETHQKKRVFMAVKAYYAVAFKQTGDNVLGLIRDFALERWQAFVGDTLASEPSIVNACGETAERAARRNAALDLRKRMLACEAQLRAI